MRSMKELLSGNVFFLTLSNVLKSLTKFVTFPYFSLYIRALGGSNVVIGLVNALTPLSAIFIYPIAGSFSDSYGRVKVILIAGIFEISIYLIYFIANDWKILALASLLTGFLYLQFPASSALMADSIPSDLTGRGFSIVNAVPGLIGIFTPLIGGYLITFFGIKFAMRLLYGSTVIALILIQVINQKFLKDVIEIKSSESISSMIRGSYRQLWNAIRQFSSNLRWYALVLGINVFFSSMASSYWIIHATDVIWLTELEWGTILLVASVIPVLLSILVGILLDRFEKNRVIAVAFILSTLPILFFPYAGSFLETLIVFVPISISEAFLWPGAVAMMADMVEKEKRGRTMAALGRGMLTLRTGGGGPGMGFLLTFPSIIGSISGGFIYETIPSFPWLLFGTSTLISGLIMAFLIKNRDNSCKHDS